MCQLLLRALVCLVLASVTAETNPYLAALKKHPYQSIQNYVQVRPGAFIFYWLYFADGTAAGAADKPLVIWIQGGPGLAASAIANFGEIGPFDTNFKPRNHTWVKGRNLLLIDHPVGTGFSYMTNEALIVTSDRGMVDDLAKTIRVFFKIHKEFQQTPTYIFGQSYGGKLTPKLAWHLHAGINKKFLKINLKGIGIGSGWVSPKESSLVMPSFLYNVGAIDYHQYIETMDMAKEIGHSIDRKKYKHAEALSTVNVHFLNQAGDLENNFNNINKDHDGYLPFIKFNKVVNKYVKPLIPCVNQSLEWKYVSEETFGCLRESFMVSTTKFVELLLNHSSIRIAVYNGNLDAITPLPGASNWIHKLRWSRSKEFMAKARNKINGHKNGFYKSVGPLSFWAVFGAGHWVPEDNPTAMEQILNHVILPEDFE